MAKKPTSVQRLSAQALQAEDYTTRAERIRKEARLWGQKAAEVEVPAAMRGGNASDRRKALACEDWPGLVLHKHPDFPEAEFWTIAHQPSGFSIAAFPAYKMNRTKAVRVLIRLADLQTLGLVDWSKDKEEVGKAAGWFIRVVMRVLMDDFNADLGTALAEAEASRKAIEATARGVKAQKAAEKKARGTKKA